VTGNGISKLVFTILSAVAEAERDRTRERIAKVKRDQRQRGRYLGGAGDTFAASIGLLRPFWDDSIPES
jgi:DNA invertase Pin-like site-specific DNA recombinase